MREEVTAWNNIAVATVLFFMVVKMYPKNPSNFEFESYVCKKINSNLQFNQPLKNEDIDICHILPSKKGKNPIIIKFIKRTIRNEIFFQKKISKI